jgi:DNA polymerase-3 subunit delta
VIIFLYGSDSFRTHQKLLEIKNKYLTSDKSGSGLSFCDADEEKKNLSKIKNSLETANLFASKRLLIVKNTISSGSEQEQKDILEYLQKNWKKIGENSDSVAVFWEGSSPKKNNALFKFLEKNAKKQNFEKLSGIKLTQWTLKTLKEIDPDAKISQPALKKLASFAPDDTGLIFSELQKLAAYSDGEMITEKDVELLVKANLAGNIFTTVEALGANNKKLALKLIHEHLEIGDDPFYLLSMIAYQFRTMLKIADLAEKNITSEYEISKITKLHPFVIRKNLAQIKYFTFPRLKKNYQKLATFDTLIKTGKLDIKLALDKLLVEL